MPAYEVTGIATNERVSLAQAASRQPRLVLFQARSQKTAFTQMFFASLIDAPLSLNQRVF